MLERLMFRLALSKALGRVLGRFKFIAAAIRAQEQLWVLNKHKSVKKSILLFALPKSGSTWLEEILAVYLNLVKYMPPSLVRHETRYKESTSSILRLDMLPNIDKPFISKTHVFPSHRLKNDLVSYDRVVVLKRDLGEVVKSHLRYVLNTPFHPDHEFIAKLSKEEAINWINFKYVPMWKEWESQWVEYAEQRGFSVVDYQNLKTNTNKELEEILNRLNEKIDQERIDEVVKFCSSDKMKDRFVQKSFFR